MSDLGTLTLARKKQDAGKRPDPISVKIDADVYRLLKTIAAWHGKHVSEYLTETMRPIVLRDFEAIKRGSLDAHN